MAAETAKPRTVTDTYNVRPYEPGDRDDILSLYEAVFGRTKDAEWFAWKYENNPYVDHVPIFVATADGAIVGARPFFALCMSCNRRHDVVLQPCDAMVHPDHRRQGLFTRMTERAIERYGSDCRYFFNFPNELSLSGNRKLGWRSVSELVSYYRIENPGGLAAARSDSAFARIGGELGTAFAQGYYRLRDTLSTSPSELSVRTEEDVPTEELTALYRKSVPDEIHVVRDERFYGWRFRNPDWNYTTYFAGTEEEMEAAVVVGTSTDSDPTTTRFVDTVPLEGASEGTAKALIETVLNDQSDTDVFCTRAQGLSESVLRGFGFHRDDTLPLSLLTTQTNHAVRALTDGWDPHGIDITDPDNWRLTFAVHDTS